MISEFPLCSNHIFVLGLRTSFQVWFFSILSNSLFIETIQLSTLISYANFLGSILDNKERLTCLEMLANFLLVCVPAFLSPRIKSFEWSFHKTWWSLCILNSISISSSFFLFFLFFIALYSFYLLYDPLRPCFIYLEIYAFNTFL